MEIRWLWKILTITLLMTKNSFGQNLNLQNSVEKKTSDFKSLNKLNSKTSGSTPNRLARNDAKEEFLDTLSDQPHSRKKRLIWVTDDGRLALPPGTTLSITPTIAMPLVRYPPEGFLSNITVSFPVTIDFDKLGLTDNENPLGVLPPVFARSFGHATGDMLGNYIASYLHYRVKRDLSDSDERNFRQDHFKIKLDPQEQVIAPEMPKNYKHAFHGGERAILYGVVEDFMATFGMNGKACLLRTICEVHSRSLDHFGVFGEMIKLFLTATKSPFAHHISEYVRAQEVGEGKIGPGECFPYYKDCPKGLFKVFQDHKYSENPDDQSYNEIENDIFKKEFFKEKISSEINSM